MRLRARAIPLAAAALACAVVSCINLSNPSDGVFSLSEVQLPLPAVVVNDTMRDSTGQVAPVRVIAYRSNGDTISAAITFVALDPGAHFEGPLLIGDSAGTSVRVVGASALLQTLPTTVLVTLSPDTIIAADSTVQHATFSLNNGDTVATSADLSTLVQHLDPTPTGVDGVIVYYAITQSPPAATGHGPSAVLTNGTAVDRDTTSGGVAARSLRLRINALTNVVADTAVVTASAAYRGHTIGTVEFTVVFISQ